MNTNLLNGAFAPQPTFRDTALISNSKITLTVLGNELLLYAADSDTPILRADLHEPPLCALDCGDTIIVMTDSAPRFIHCESGQWSLLPVPATAPAAVFRAEPAAAISASTGSIVSSRGTSLSDGIQPGSSLQRKITSALTEAYSSLIAAAREGRYYLQPVVARALFLDSAGATVAVSAPQLVALSPSQTWQMASPVTAAVTKRSDTDFTITPFTLSATPWTLHVDFPGLADHPHYCRVAAIRILLSQPVDFLDTGAQSPVRFSQTHGNSPGCTAAVPGATVALSPITARFCERTANVASVSSAYLAATLPPDASDVQIPHPLASVPHPIPRQVPFTAGCVTRSGSTVAWGDVRTLPPMPPEPAELLLPGDEQLTVKVEIYGGKTRLAARTSTASSLSRIQRRILFTDHPDATEARLTFPDTSQTLVLPLLQINRMKS